MEEKKNQNIGSKLFFCGVLIIFLISLIGVASVGYIVIKRNNQSGEQEESKSSSSSSESYKDTIQDFSSNTIYEPKENIVDLVKESSSAVVTVVSKKTVTDVFLDEIEEIEQGVGTGFFISENGLLITNEHVVCGAAASDLTIITGDNKSYKVESFASDPVQDIAIVKVNILDTKVPFLKFANPDSRVEIGQEVIAIGNPLGVNPGSVTKGIVSGLGRDVKAQGACGDRMTQKEYEGLIQTDAAINSGNSGGPLINLLGEVIGVNSATSMGANNISYAVPSQRVIRTLNRYLNNNGKIILPVIGVEYSMIDPNLSKTKDIPLGAFVRKVIEDSPAEKAGIKRGDIITKLGDRNVEFSLQALLNEYFEPGQSIEIEVYRPGGTSPVDDEILLDGKYIKLNLTVGERSVSN